MKTRCRAPLRASYSGGGTDVEPYLSLYGGGEVLYSALAMHAYCSVEDGGEKEILIQEGSDAGQPYDPEAAPAGPLKLVKASIKVALDGKPPPRGLSVLTWSDARPGSGLGSSSALAVAVVTAVRMHLKRCNTSSRALAEDAFRAERELAGIRGGKQDQYAAAYGGLLSRATFRKDESLVYPLWVGHSDTTLELEANLMLVDTGCVRTHLGVIGDQAGRVEEHSPGEEIFRLGYSRLKALCNDMEAALFDGRPDDFGRMLGEAWEAKKKLSPLISTPHIDSLYDVARDHGALGGKLLGAGGGGHLLLYVPPERRRAVEFYMRAGAAAVVPFRLNPHGVQVWRTR